MYKIFSADKKYQLEPEQINMLSSHSKYLKVILESLTKTEEVALNVDMEELQCIIQLLTDLQEQMNRNKIQKDEYQSLGLILLEDNQSNKQEFIDQFLLKKIDNILEKEQDISKKFIRLTQLTIVVEYLDIEYLHKLLCIKLATLIDTYNIDEIQQGIQNIQQQQQQ